MKFALKHLFAIACSVFILLSATGCQGDSTVTSAPCSTSSVEEFISVLADTEKEDVDAFGHLWSGNPQNAENCYNVTPKEVSAVCDIQIFKFSDSCASFAFVDGEAYEICISLGGYGFVNAIPWDYDEDGNMDLLVASSWGSGIHRSEISVFNAVTKESVVVYSTVLTDEPDVDLIVGTYTMALSSKKPEDIPASYGVFSADIKPGDHLADLSYESTGLVGTVYYENGEFIFDPVN